jgi:ubiquinone/menaquinone biosynthesis C-methylase UbiE
MKDFYENFYAAMARSKAHAEFCERVYGVNLCQHGFADMAQLDALIKVTQLGPQHRALDLGCGNGMITEYLSDCSGAHITGLDYIPGAIRQATERTAAKRGRLAFREGDINALDLPDQAFDLIISIDSLYFSSDYSRTIRQLVSALRPGGQMVIYFAHGRVGIPKEEFPVETIQPDRTPLADALKANKLHFQTWDYTQDDYRLAQQRIRVLTELRPQFEAEDILFIYENRMGDSLGISQFIEEGMHARYLYHVRL